MEQSSGTRHDKAMTEYFLHKEKYLELTTAAKKAEKLYIAAMEKAEIEADSELIELNPEYYREGNQEKISDFLKNIQENKFYEPISTGLHQVDDLLDGGLYPGLYVLGAMSGIGKTSLCLQIADHIAESGRDVLYISFEMSRFELYTRSISRLGINHGLKLTSREIMRGDFTGNSKLTDLFSKAHEYYYEKIAKNMFIVEVGLNNQNATFEAVKDKILRHIEITKKTPIVIVDYLQLLTPEAHGFTDKQNMDRAITSLKQLTRDFNVTLIAISSLNRLSYNKPVSLESLKESGAVEYCSDCVIAIQRQGIGTGGNNEMADQEAFSKMKEKEMEFVTLKNRHAMTGKRILEWKCCFNYWI